MDELPTLSMSLHPGTDREIGVDCNLSQDDWDLSLEDFWKRIALPMFAKLHEMRPKLNGD